MIYLYFKIVYLIFQTPPIDEEAKEDAYVAKQRKERAARKRMLDSIEKGSSGKGKGVGKKSKKSVTTTTTDSSSTTKSPKRPKIKQAWMTKRIATASFIDDEAKDDEEEEEEDDDHVEIVESETEHSESEED